MSKTRFGYENPNNGTLFFLCWIAYFSTYICRLNYSAVMPELSASGLFSESQIAAVSSAFFICYGLGQLVSGAVGDKLSPRYMIFGGVLISGVSNILIFLFHTFYAALLLLWGLNGAVQSMVWSPILRVAGEYFGGREKEKFGIDIATTVPLGTLASYGVSLVTMLFLPWHYVFLTCGIIVLIAAAYWFLRTGRLLPHLKKVEYHQDDPKKQGRVLPLKKLAGMMISSGIVVLMLSIIIQGTLKDSVTQWIPTYFDSQFHTGTSISLVMTMVLPIINVTGAYFARMIDRRIRNELTTSVIFFGIAAAFLAVLLLFGSKNMILSLICMAGVTNCMFAINVMLITMVPLRFSKFGRVSTVAGLVNAMAYIGCGALNLAAGALLERTGTEWNILFILWLCLAVGALVLTASCVIPWKKFVQREKLEETEQN